MPPRHTTFVIATYERPSVLRCTLRSLVLQTDPRWTAIVVGDHCGPETADAVRSVGDPRIRYYNLPTRFGEQSGPNNAGLHLAKGDFVSFLNHDDLLLADHLERALARIAEREADFFIGRFANATRVAEDASGSAVPVFTETRPLHRDLRMLPTANMWFFEPGSFWLIRTEYAKAVGPWRPAGGMWRTPLNDWILRAWRRRGRFCFGDDVTGLRFLTHVLRRDGPTYQRPSPEHESMIARMETETPQAIREDVLRQVAASEESERRLRRAPPFPVAWMQPGRRAFGRGRRSVLARLWLDVGIDAVALVHRRRGALLDTISRRRTGAALPETPSIDAFLRDPEAHRVV